YFTMLWDGDVPHLEHIDDDGRSSRITAIPGGLEAHRRPAPQPDSSAARPDADLAIWYGEIDPEASWVLPAAGPETARCLYFFEGDALVVGGVTLDPSTGVVLDAEQAVELQATDTVVKALLLQGRPINEPVAQAGPFVMNTEDEVR